MQGNLAKYERKGWETQLMGKKGERNLPRGDWKKGRRKEKKRRRRRKRNNKTGKQMTGVVAGDIV